MFSKMAAIRLMMVAVSALIGLATATPTPGDGRVHSGTEVITQTCQLYTAKASIIQASCASGNITLVIDSVTVLSSSITSVTDVVVKPHFDPEVMSTQKSTVAQLIVTYTSIVQTIVSTPAAHKTCEKNLKTIQVKLQLIIDTCAQNGIYLNDEVQKLGGIKEDALAQLGCTLELNPTVSKVSNGEPNEDETEAESYESEGENNETEEPNDATNEETGQDINNNKNNKTEEQNNKNEEQTNKNEEQNNEEIEEYNKH